MTDYQWEEIAVPAGSFIGWGTKPGQHVTGKVLDYEPSGGTDFNDDPCPQLTVELAEPAASFNKDGDRTDYPAGELVILTCGLVSLKRAVRAASPNPGDMIKITLTGLVKTARGTVKEMGIKIARGTTPTPAPAPAANPFAPTAQGEMPF